MDLDEARAFLRNNHRAVIVTLREDGWPQPTPVTVGLDEDGRAEVSSRETSFKVKNLRRDPRVSVCVLNDGFYGQWAYVAGRATIVSLPEAMEGLVEYYRRISGEHPDWDDYRAAMERDRRVLIKVDIERAGPSQEG